MFSPNRHARNIAAFVTVSYFFMLAVEALPLAARAQLKKPQVVASVLVSGPGFLEQAGNSGTVGSGRAGCCPAFSAWPWPGL